MEGINSRSAGKVDKDKSPKSKSLAFCLKAAGVGKSSQQCQMDQKSEHFDSFNYKVKTVRRCEQRILMVPLSCYPY